MAQYTNQIDILHVLWPFPRCKTKSIWESREAGTPLLCYKKGRRWKGRGQFVDWHASFGLRNQTCRMCIEIVVQNQNDQFIKLLTKTEGERCHLTLWQETDKSQCVSYSRMWCPQWSKGIVPICIERQGNTKEEWIENTIQLSEKRNGLLYYTLAFHVYLDICLFTCIYNDMSTELHSKMSIEILSEMYRLQWLQIFIYSVHPWRFFKVSIWKCCFSL